MQQITHTTTKNKLLFVELPDDAYDVKQITTDRFNAIDYRRQVKWADEMKFVEKGYTLIGKVSDITEDIAKGIVDVWKYSFPKRESIYTNYKHETLYCNTALQSFNSLIEHLGIVVRNKYGDKPPMIIDAPFRMTSTLKDDIELWQTEQARIKNYYLLTAPLK